MEAAVQRKFLNATPLTRDLVVAAGLGVACIAARVLSLEWLPIPGVTRMAILWLPTVFLLVALLLSPYRRWWLLVAASGLAAFLGMGDAAPGAAAVMEAANSGQALTAAWVLRALHFRPRDVLTIRGMVAFLVIAVCLAPLAFSLLSAGLLNAGGWIDSFETNWRARCITNMPSALTVAPPLLLAFSRRKLPSSTALFEGAALLVCIPLLETVVTRMTTDIVGIATVLLYLPIPFFLWAAMRLGPAGVSLTALMILLTRVYPDAPILSSVFGTQPSDSLLTLQIFVTALAVPFMLLAVIIDERRRSEAKIRSSAERHRIATSAGRVGAWDWNLVTGEIFLDPSLKAMLGYADFEIANDLAHWHEHVHRSDRERVAASIEAHLERGEPFEIEHRMLHKDGSIRWFLARGSVIDRDADGKPTRMMGTDVDVTERRHIEDALQALRASIHQSGRTGGMSTLAASVAHEVNQPLFAIMANAQACLQCLDAERPDLAEIRDAVHDIVGAGQQAGNIIDRTRAMFRQRTVEQQPVSINEAVSMSIEIMQRQLQDADVTVETDCPPGLPEVLGDKVQLQQVLDNLIANAVEALRRTDRPRYLKIKARAATGGVQLTVRDSGCGITQEHLRHIFDPFFSTRRGGLGLGLAISRSIVIAHGGEIHAERATEGGMSFQLLLPAAEQEKGLARTSGHP